MEGRGGGNESKERERERDRERVDCLARRSIPKRLEEELAHAPKFKPALVSTRGGSVGISGIGSRNLTVGDVMSRSVESAMYDEIMGPLVNRKPAVSMTPRLEAALARNNAIRTAGASPTLQAPGVNLPSNSPDITVSLLARLTDCEADLTATRRQLAVKTRRVTELEDENKELKALLVEPAEVYEELDFVKGQNQDLLVKLKEMEAFLKDYGLQWVGTPSIEDPSPARDHKSNEGSSSPHLSFSSFSKKIQELNDVINSEPTQVVTEEGGKITKLARPSEILEQIRIVFYSNGLMVRRGPFRDCDSDSYKQFTRDVMDGYFPTEFKDDYPEGVVFTLVDRHNAVYDSSAADKEDMLTAQQFFQKLPKTIIKNGEIVDIRSSLQDRLVVDNGVRDNQAKDASKQLPTADRKREQLVLKSSGFLHCDAAHRKPVTVQLRWIDGSIIIVKLDFSEDVGTIRSLVERHFVGEIDTVADTKGEEANLVSSTPVFELRTVWPARCVEDDCSLAEAGLVPNGTLHAVRKRI
jgi:hypothetical protein